MPKNRGEIYLIHFEKHYHHARHYIGFTKTDSRTQRHLDGRGSKLLKAVDAAGIAFQVVRTWEGDRHLERKLKNRKKAAKLCPICREEKKAGRGQGGASLDNTQNVSAISVVNAETSK